MAIPFPTNLFITPESLSKKLGTNYKALSRLIYPSTDRSYRSFVIAKKSGGERIIFAPKLKLKGIQRELSKEFLKIYNPKLSCHGFLPGRGITSNASRHVGKKFVFNIDISDFFGTIHFGRVRNLFLKPPFNYSHSTATVLAQICCHKGVFPQGAPTSPIISNFICWKLDAQLQQLAHKHNCDYTRYVDDITFSFTTTKRKLPRSIIGFDEEGVAVVGKALKRIIEENGFSINKEKVRLQSRGDRQEVTGITVNDFVNVNRSFVRKTASMIYAMEKFGAKNAEKEHLEKFRDKPLLERQKKAILKKDGEFFIDVVKGRVNYIQMVRGRGDQVYRNLAYRLTRAMGCENKEFLRTAKDLISDSVFIVHNNLDNSQGSAFMLANIGLIANEHVIDGISHENHELIEFFRDYEIGKKRTSTYLWSNKSKDIGIFVGKKGFEDIPPLRIGNDAKLRVGDSVTVVGYPGYSEGESAYINTGKIIQSALRYGVKFFLLDIPIIHGNSGGPVLNSNLEVVGIATRGSSTHDQSTKFNGFIPISTIIEETKSYKYKSIERYSILLDNGVGHIGENEVFFYNGLAYCTKCFVDKKFVSIMAETKEKNTFNCTYCSRLYKYMPNKSD